MILLDMRKYFSTREALQCQPTKDTASNFHVMSYKEKNIWDKCFGKTTTKYVYLTSFLKRLSQVGIWLAKKRQAKINIFNNAVLFQTKVLTLNYSDIILSQCQSLISFFNIKSLWMSCHMCPPIWHIELWNKFFENTTILFQ